MRFEAVSPDVQSKFFAQAVEFYGDQKFESLQLYWPDKDGNFPNDEYAPAWLNARQRLKP